jgi:hypothetical protein
MAAAVGLLLSASPAKALTLTATPTNLLASGSYNVVLTPTGGSTYQITVQGNPDGRVVADGSGPAKHSVGRISVGFLRSDFTFIPTLGGSGGTNSGGAYVGAPFTVVVEADVLRFNSPNEINDVGPFGENLFVGSVTLSTSELPDQFTVALQDGTQQWFAQGAVGLVPEPASLALALPGLLPVGMLLLRRRRKGAAEPAEES